MKLVLAILLQGSFLFSAAYGQWTSGVPTFDSMFADQVRYSPEKVAADQTLRNVVSAKYYNSDELPPRQYLYILKVMRHTFQNANQQLENVVKSLEENIAVKEQYILVLEQEKRELQTEIDQLTRAIEDLTRKIREKQPPLL